MALTVILLGFSNARAGRMAPVRTPGGLWCSADAVSCLGVGAEKAGACAVTAVSAAVGLGYAVGSASSWTRRCRWLCHLRIVAGRQTGSRPILRSAAGIWPRAAYARTVDGATSR